MLSNIPFIFGTHQTVLCGNLPHSHVASRVRYRLVCKQCWPERRQVSVGQLSPPPAHRSKWDHCCSKPLVQVYLSSTSNVKRTHFLWLHKFTAVWLTRSLGAVYLDTWLSVWIAAWDLSWWLVYSIPFTAFQNHVSMRIGLLTTMTIMQSTSTPPASSNNIPLHYLHGIDAKTHNAENVRIAANVFLKVIARIFHCTPTL